MDTFCDKCRKTQPSHSCQDITSLGRCALEKQGEQNQKHFELKAGHWYICHRAFCCRADDITVKEGERFMCKENGVVKGFVIKDPEKYFVEVSAPAPTDDEKKSVYKTEPKFKVGDWIINSKGTIARVNDVKKDIYGTLRYNIEFSNGNKSDPMPCFVDCEYHPFTTKDAKEGDVLVSGEVIFIFNLIHGIWLNCHCSLHKDGSFNDGDYDLMTSRYFDEVYPATKEQRDTLFAKMKEHGYEWNADKRELKKIDSI